MNGSARARRISLMADEKKLTTRAEDFSAWYNEVVLRAELADYSPVRGCMVIRPDGYGIWERMQRAMDDLFKASSPGPIPDGEAKGTAIIAPGTTFSPEIAEFISHFAWQGKA